MGILTRQLGVKYVISSDQLSGDAASKRAPRTRGDVYQVWTGARWSPNSAEALSFNSLDDADDYVRMHYSIVSAQIGT